MILVALGGGVIGDLVGFAAAFFVASRSFRCRRHCWLGGQLGRRKDRGSPLPQDLIGAFHQPRAVLADMASLDTLADRELRAGYAEVVKYGPLGDAAFFEWLEANGADVLARDDGAGACVTTSCRAKARIVEADEREAASGRFSIWGTPLPMPLRRCAAMTALCFMARRSAPVALL